jgi:hypothetical protein
LFLPIRRYDLDDLDLRADCKGTIPGALLQVRQELRQRQPGRINE